MNEIQKENSMIEELGIHNVYALRWLELDGAEFEWEGETYTIESKIISIKSPYIAREIHVYARSESGKVFSVLDELDMEEQIWDAIEDYEQYREYSDKIVVVDF